MQHRFYLAPAGAKVGLTTISLGLVRALDRRGIRVGFFKPISQPAAGDTGPDRSSHFLEAVMGCKTAVPIPKPEAERALRQNRIQDLLERIVGNYRKVYQESDVLIIEGLVPTATGSFASQLNPAIVKALSAQVILVSSLASGDLTEFTNQIEFAASQFGGVNNREVIGCVANKAHVNARGDFEPVPASIVAENDGSSDSTPLAVGDAAAGLRRVLSERCSCFRNPTFDLIGAVPWNASLPAKRLSDVAEALKAEILHKGDMDQRRVQSIALCARTIPYMLHVLKPATLLVTPPDRQDIIIAAAMAAMNKVPLAGLLLVGEYRPDPKVFEFIRAALETGLPILYVNSQSYHTATALFQMSDEVPLDDVERVDRVMEFTASQIDADWLLAYCKTSFEQRMSPAAFRYQLVEKARQKRRRIILPEGEEPRTIEAAVQCQTRGIADCILMGDPESIQHNAHAGGLELPAELTLMNPINLRYRYVEPLMEFRKHKKLAFDQAEVLLKDNVVLGTVMLALGEVDGLVSGAVHSTANTIRPALQIIKTREEAKVVSSVFFMCLPEHVLVYGDCAIVPDPDAEALADIAIQSAESAERFSIPARVAMISYSTGESGSGTDVDKVRKATERVKQLRPDIVIDGPLQYDAASTPDVAAKKAPNSPVAGKATVFVFPDLNTGNTTYKAVQRSANVVSIGPMLQGLKKPVNDLSRGALVEDIIYTIALTAVQAGD